MALASAAAWRDFLREAPDAHLRTRPAPDVWSPVQYGAHSRDMLRVFGDRILRAVAEDDPVVTSFEPTLAEWEAYQHLGRTELAGELERQAVRLARILGGLRPGDWGRTARRDGVDRFTVSGLACFGVHEAHHHLLDANGTLAPR